MTFRHKLRKPKISHVFIRTINTSRIVRARAAKKQDSLNNQVQALAKHASDLTDLLGRTMDVVSKTSDQFDHVLKNMEKLINVVDKAAVPEGISPDPATHHH